MWHPYTLRRVTMPRSEPESTPSNGQGRLAREAEDANEHAYGGGGGSGPRTWDLDRTAGGRDYDSPLRPPPYAAPPPYPCAPPPYTAAWTSSSPDVSPTSEPRSNMTMTASNQVGHAIAALRPTPLTMHMATADSVSMLDVYVNDVSRESDIGTMAGTGHGQGAVRLGRPRNRAQGRGQPAEGIANVAGASSGNSYYDGSRTGRAAEARASYYGDNGHGTGYYGRYFGFDNADASANKGDGKNSNAA